MPFSQKRIYKTRDLSIIKRITVDNEKQEIEVSSTLLGYPIKFAITDELREFLKAI